jgi:hypothetical protein
LRRYALLAAVAATAGGCGGGDGGDKGTAVTFQRPAATTPAAGGLRPAQAEGFTLKVPAGWTRQDSTLAGGIQRSEWRDPAAAGTSVLVDAVTSASSTAQDRATRNRARGSAKAGYRERTFEPATLAGRDGWLWDYQLPDRRVVDYFLNDCGDGFAVQGTAAVQAFPRVERLFRQVAESLHSKHC